MVAFTGVHWFYFIDGSTDGNFPASPTALPWCLPPPGEVSKNHGVDRYTLIFGTRGRSLPDILATGSLLPNHIGNWKIRVRFAC